MGGKTAAANRNDLSAKHRLRFTHESVSYTHLADGSMTIAEAAALAGTNKNDIIGRIPARPPRVYL